MILVLFFIINQLTFEDTTITGKHNNILVKFVAELRDVGVFAVAGMDLQTPRMLGNNQVFWGPATCITKKTWSPATCITK